VEEQVRELKSVAARDAATPARPVINLAQALRRARTDDAARADAINELRGAELARLEALEDALQPVLEQLPKQVDLFDVGVMPGEKPRLFIDMIGFVEMGRDRKAYRFLQDTRHGRITLAESETVETIVEAVTTYIARRMVEREKALAADMTVEQAARALLTGAPAPQPAERAATAEAPPRPAPMAEAPARSAPVHAQPAAPGSAYPAPVYAQPEQVYAPPIAAGYAPMPLAQAPLMRPAGVAALRAAAARPAAPAPAAWRPSVAFTSFLFIIEVLGAATFFALIGLAVWGVWQAAGGWAQNAVEKL
jgi:hypothetical protein